MELATLDGLNNLPASGFDDKEFDKVSGGRFLPRLMLYGSKSDAVAAGKVEVGFSYVEGKDGYTFVGRDVDVLPLAWRPKALDMSGDQIIANHDINSEQFKQIRHRADNVQNSSCMYGPEYLVWIPSIGKFATFLMGSKTARNEAPKMKERLRKPATLKTKLFANKDYKWHGTEVVPCSTPFELPSIEEITEQVTTFNNPPKSTVEVVEEATTGSGRDR